MTLTVEDGSGVTDADSYITLADARTFAASRGISISATDATAEIQLRRAFDALEAYGSRFKGAKSVVGQATQWPRTGAYIDVDLWASDAIPTALKNAQVHFAAAIEAGLDPIPNSTGEAFVVRETIGQIETEYSESVSNSGVPILRTMNFTLAPLLNGSGALSVERA
jgi:hypothetical protein